MICDSRRYSWTDTSVTIRGFYVKATICKSRQLQHDCWKRLPESRVISVDYVARADRRVRVECTVLVAVVLPLERRDVLGVTLHDDQQIVTDARPSSWRRRPNAVVTHHLVISLQRDTVPFALCHWFSDFQAHPWWLSGSLARDRKVASSAPGQSATE